MLNDPVVPNLPQFYQDSARGIKSSPHSPKQLSPPKYSPKAVKENKAPNVFTELIERSVSPSLTGVDAHNLSQFGTQNSIQLEIVSD